MVYIDTDCCGDDCDDKEKRGWLRLPMEKSGCARAQVKFDSGRRNESQVKFVLEMKKG